MNPFLYQVSLPFVLLMSIVSATGLSGQESPSNAATHEQARSPQDVSADHPDLAINPDLAIKRYESIVAANPTNLEAQANLGVLLFFAGRWTDAIGHLSRALSIDPHLDRIRALLGICEKHTGEIEEAQRDLDLSLKSLKETKIRILAESNLADLYFEEGDLQQAASAAADLLKDSPNSPDAIYMVYRIHSEIAERARQALATIAPDSARMHEMTAEHFINEGDASDAITQYERALAVDPQLPGAKYELAEALLADSTSAASFDRATALLKEVFIQDPGNAGAEAKLGEIEIIRGHANAARDYFSRALALNPNELSALKGMAKLARESRDDEKAEEYLVRASRIDPLDASLHYQLLQVYRQAHQEDEAKKQMEIFLKIRDLKKKTELVELKEIQ